MLVSTEHDNVVDYRPLAREMGLAKVLRVIPGLELTSIARTEEVPHTAGHANVLPLAPEPFTAAAPCAARASGCGRRSPRRVGGADGASSSSTTPGPRTASATTRPS